MKNKALQLCGTFLKIGAFTFGGGYAMIPLIQREIVEKRAWLTEEDLAEIIAVAEATPGPIAVNAATFVGRRVGGFRGAVLATLGVVLPSFLIILALSALGERVGEFRAVRYALWGIKAAVLALILKALLSMFRQSPKYAVSYGIMAAAFVLTAVLRLPAAAVIVGSAVLGLIAFCILEGRKAP